MEFGTWKEANLIEFDIKLERTHKSYNMYHHQIKERSIFEWEEMIEYESVKGED